MEKLLWTYYTIMLRKLFVRPFGEVKNNPKSSCTCATYLGSGKPDKGVFAYAKIWRLYSVDTFSPCCLLSGVCGKSIRKNLTSPPRWGWHPDLFGAAPIDFCFGKIGTRPWITLRVTHRRKPSLPAEPIGRGSRARWRGGGLALHRGGDWAAAGRTGGMQSPAQWVAATKSHQALPVCEPKAKPKGTPLCGGRYMPFLRHKTE